jgi:hypothetical protein
MREKATFQAYLAHLEAQSPALASVNQKLSAIRKLAFEASYNGLLDPAAAQAIRDVRGAKMQGTRAGNWLPKEQGVTGYAGGFVGILIAVAVIAMVAPRRIPSI